MSGIFSKTVSLRFSAACYTISRPIERLEQAC
jgi:hypothetical protein